MENMFIRKIQPNNTDSKYKQVSELKLTEIKKEKVIDEQNQAVVVIELAVTYTRHTIHATVEGSEEPIVYTSEKHPYCYELNEDGTITSYGYQALNLQKGCESQNERFYYFKNIHQGKQIGVSNTPTNVSYKTVFSFHIAEANLYISKTFSKESKNVQIGWIIVLPAGTNKDDRAVIKRSAEEAGLTEDECQYVFPADLLALKEVQTKTGSAYERRTAQTSFVYVDNGSVETCSYDIFTKATIYNNSRKTVVIDGGSISEWIEKFLCEIFSKEFIDWYHKNHIYEFHHLCTDFEKQFVQNDIENGDIALHVQHMVQKTKTNHPDKSVETLLYDSQYQDYVSYNDTTFSLILSSHVLQGIWEDYVAICQNVLPKDQTSLKCYISVNQSLNFQQRLQQVLQSRNIGLLSSLACKKGKPVISDFTYGYVAIESFNKKLHSDENKCRIDPDYTGEEYSVWVFKPLIRKGEKIRVSYSCFWKESITFFSLRKKVSKHQTLLLRSTSRKPQYTNWDRPAVATIIEVYPPNEGWPDEVEFKYTLTFTERGPTIQAVDMKSGRKHQVFTSEQNIEFVNDPDLIVMNSVIPTRLKSGSIKRRATYTYGINNDPSFKRGEVKIRGRGHFRKLIEKGQVLTPGQVFYRKVETPFYFLPRLFLRDTDLVYKVIERDSGSTLEEQIVDV